MRVSIKPAKRGKPIEDKKESVFFSRQIEIQKEDEWYDLGEARTFQVQVLKPGELPAIVEEDV